jgi:hypothetical protein
MSVTITPRTVSFKTTPNYQRPPAIVFHPSKSNNNLITPQAITDNHIVMSAASFSASLQIIDEDNDDNANADANLTGPSVITQCLSPSSPNHTNMLSEETPIPDDLEQLTIPFYDLADSAPFMAQLQSILKSTRMEASLDTTLTIERLLSISYQLLTAVGLSSSSDRQPTISDNNDFPGTIVQPLLNIQGFGGGGGGGSDPDDSGDESGNNSDEDDIDDDSPNDDEEMSKSKVKLKEKNDMIKKKMEEWKIWKCAHRALENSLEILVKAIHAMKSHHLHHANQARTHAQWYKDSLKGIIKLPVSNMSLLLLFHSSSSYISHIRHHYECSNTNCTCQLTSGTLLLCFARVETI